MQWWPNMDPQVPEGDFVVDVDGSLIPVPSRPASRGVPSELAPTSVSSLVGGTAGGDPVPAQRLQRISEADENAPPEAPRDWREDYRLV